MEATLTYKANGADCSATRDLPNSEQGFWREVASLLPVIDIPSTLHIKAHYDDGCCSDAELNITKRGTFMKDGVETPSMFVIPVYNDITLSGSSYEDAYLTCINPDTKGGRGNYKFYRLSQRSDGMVTAFYGRIGQSCGFGAEREIKDPMPSWMFEIRKAEKITKGYVDRTSTYCDGKSYVVGESSLSSSAPSGNLYQRLLAFAKKRVERSLATGTVVTSAQVEKCGNLLNRLGRCRKVDSFNERLLELMSISPRRVAAVTAEMARTPEDFGRIIDREESLLAAMRAVANSDKLSVSRTHEDGFAQNSINCIELSGDEFNHALRFVPNSLRSRVRRVYSIDSARQRLFFNEYLEKRNLGESDIKLMWHGSRNENWCSIVSRSLMLNPNAAITGKMFGYGIYFGYDGNNGGALKSWNYTSARGSYWAKGNSDTAFMGLYECAYGKPYSPDSVRSFDKNWLDSRGFDCVHAQGGKCGLRYDEVVFYDESAVCIKYLFEFSC